jgi:hypothetical protein
MVNVLSVSAYFCNLLSDFMNVLRSWNFLIVLQNFLAFIVLFCHVFITILEQNGKQKLFQYEYVAFWLLSFCDRNPLRHKFLSLNVQENVS